jgi:hypothetical protein
VKPPSDTLLRYNYPGLYSLVLSDGGIFNMKCLLDEVWLFFSIPDFLTLDGQGYIFTPSHFIRRERRTPNPFITQTLILLGDLLSLPVSLDSPSHKENTKKKNFNKGRLNWPGKAVRSYLALRPREGNGPIFGYPRRTWVPHLPPPFIRTPLEWPEQFSTSKTTLS